MSKNPILVGYTYAFTSSLFPPLVTRTNSVLVYVCVAARSAQLNTRLLF